MRIGIDATFLAFPLLRDAGIGRYIRNLLEALAELDSENEYFLFLGDEGPLWALPGNWRRIISHLPLRHPAVRVFWHHLFLPPQCRRRKLDLLFSPAFTLPWWLPRGLRTVATVHDLSFLRHPEMYQGALRLAYLRRAVARTAQRADAIVCPSEATKKDVVELLGVPPRRISVSYHGVAPLGELSSADEARHAPLPCPMKSRYGLGDSFFLFVGTLEARKNVAALIRAFHQLRQRGRPELRLVVVGKGARAFLKKTSLAFSKEVEGVIFTGFLPDQELWALYRSATVFVSLSLWEGFGFPLLEAMAAGLPVIASKVGSIPELVGDAAMLVDPDDSPSVVLAMERVLQDENLRRCIADRARQRVKEFNWRKAAKETLDVFQRAGGGR